MIEHNLSAVFKIMGEFRSRSALLRSKVYKSNRSEIERILGSVELCDRGMIRPKNPSFLRVISWNIERGKRCKEISDFLKTDSLASLADLILLQEVDQGMARSGNKDIAAEISSSLGMHHVFVPQSIELSHGKERFEAEIPTPDTGHIHGVAILSRYPVKKAWSFPLYDCDTSKHTFKLEPRIGGKRALIVELDILGKMLTVVDVHLSVFTTPECRLRQAKVLVERLKDISGPLIIAGDFNTTTIRRGSKINELYEAIRFIFSDFNKYIYNMTHPDTVEPLFGWMEQNGYNYIDANRSDKITAYTRLRGLADIKWLPGLLKTRILNRVEQLNYRVPMNLDWFFLKGAKPLKQGDIETPASIAPTALTPDFYSNEVLSDHAAIIVDIRI